MIIVCDIEHAKKLKFYEFVRDDDYPDLYYSYLSNRDAVWYYEHWPELFLCTGDDPSLAIKQYLRHKKSLTM